MPFAQTQDILNSEPAKHFMTRGDFGVLFVISALVILGLCIVIWRQYVRNQDLHEKRATDLEKQTELLTTVAQNQTLITEHLKAGKESDDQLKGQIGTLIALLQQKGEA